MSVFFSASKLGYYPAADRKDYETAKSWPDDAVEMTPAELKTFWRQTAPAGRVLGSNKGRPAWVEGPPPSAAQILRQRDQALAEANFRISPLQYAVDLNIAGVAEIAKLEAWKRYAVQLIRLEAQPQFPETFYWPAQPT